MFTVALIGPDGAGKTTVGQNIGQMLPVPAKYMYMGVNLDASNCMSPLTRVIHCVRRKLGKAKNQSGPRFHDEPIRSSKGPVEKVLRWLKSWLALVNRLTDEWYRQCVAWYYQARGYVVIYDRHFFPDFFAYDIRPLKERRRITDRIHGFMLMRLFPRPDLVIFLDAPAEVLLKRKGEGTLELLEQRRRDYLEIQQYVEHFEVIESTQSLDITLQRVSDLVTNLYLNQLKAKSTHA